MPVPTLPDPCHPGTLPAPLPAHITGLRPDCGAHSGIEPGRRPIPPHSMARTRSVLISGLLGALIGITAIPATALADTANSTNTAKSAALPPDAFPGGQTTWQAKTGPRNTPSRNADRMALTHPSANMTFEKRLDFKLGEAIFQRLWVTAPTRTKAADGLGPLFNSRACTGCHIRNGRGHAIAPDDENVPPTGQISEGATSLLLRLSVPPTTDAQKQSLASHRQSSIPEPVYGGQFQDFSIPGIPAEGRVHLRYDMHDVRLADGSIITLRRPEYSFGKLAYGPMRDDVMISPRVTPPVMGLGLIEAIPDAAIAANADPDDRNHDGISGRVNRVWDIARGQVANGRFGWKAGMPALDQQNQNALQFDIGLSTPLYPDGAGDCTQAQSACRNAPNGNDPQFDNREIHGQLTGLLLYYVRNIAPPLRPDANDPDIRAGQEIFNRIGCASCHIPSYQLPERADMPEQSGQLIWPYGDFLLHDMGDGLADHRPEGLADGREWRTAPLWGIGYASRIDPRAGFLHDGRARTLLEAILWHGGEAQAARDAVTILPLSDRSKLLAFLNSL